MGIQTKYSTLFENYYIREDLAKNEYEDFLNKDEKESLQKLFDSFDVIEKNFNLKLPEMYKNFVKEKVAWGLEGANNNFILYDEKEIYEFNYIDSHKGKSSIIEMKNFFIFGQDDGECSYFFDSFNKLGYGSDAVWKINRGFIDNGNTWFDLISGNFYDFIESCVNKNDSDSNYVFNSESKFYEIANKDYITYLINECKNHIDNSKNIQNEIEKVKKYLSIINTRMEYYCEDFNDEHFLFIKENEALFLENKALANLLYIILNTNFVILKNNKIRFLFLTSNILKKRNTTLWKKKMFVFACNEHSLLTSKLLTWDLFFIDSTNKLGNGSDAIYMICEDSKKLEEACYVAKNIVDLFRIFAEGEKLHITPIGKIK